jgi:hypothetical protein
MFILHFNLLFLESKAKLDKQNEAARERGNTGSNAKNNVEHFGR